jgi:hypothetical protein
MGVSGMVKKKSPSVLFDFETLCNRPSSKVVSFSAVVFNENELDVFKDLVNDEKRTFNCKISVKGTKQSHRTISQEVLDWWAKQPPEVQSILRSSDEDVELDDMILNFKEFLDVNGVCEKNSLGYVRGPSFDFAIMSDIVHQFGLFKDRGYSMFPVAFWNQRDIRSAIAYALLDPQLRKVPVQKGTFDGFVKHNSLHDCCKDVILLQTVLGYGNGTISPPDEIELI